MSSLCTRTRPKKPGVFLTLLNAGARDNLDGDEKGEACNIFHSVVWYKDEFYNNLAEIVGPLHWMRNNS